MSTYVFAFLIGVIAGLRSLTAPAAVSWAARLGWLHLENTWLAFLGFAATPYIISALAIGELIRDKLPTTESRKAPRGFITRILTGALSGAALGGDQRVLDHGPGGGRRRCDCRNTWRLRIPRPPGQGQRRQGSADRSAGRRDRNRRRVSDRLSVFLTTYFGKTKFTFTSSLVYFNSISSDFRSFVYWGKYK
jgi:hypothetical protein